ncbi:hypothetical protein J3B02_000190 [Coemansia erecta]|uniref:2-methoxy-6-polyprenyl-1,4-benzoquinol methylase, mitochondrial n=1 Tax=Coemansia asiatica TaxID=1052880 RepID=A0A9W7XJ42_9FUNG|nr:hypothetical protein LPJ64_002733 [Coemansia asiatica]KAJ2858440.1 hypothetical protein J3B02_000190 [Coemansia erecta]KAJ2868229.1 hypothetical protein FB639_004881 [Coemansia asiatica]
MIFKSLLHRLNATATAPLVARPPLYASTRVDLGLRWSSGVVNNAHSSSSSSSSFSSCSATSSLYSDTVPISQKEEIMDEVYCKVADRYDAVIDILSVFMNTMWKRNFVKQIKPQPGALMLDVAGGTGEIANHYLQYQDKVNRDKTSSVKIVDYNPHMLRVGMKRLGNSEWMRDGRVSFVQGNAEDLDGIADSSVDVYSISAGMHNLPHPERALKAAYRVLKPGGTFACLEYGHVDAPVIGPICRWYMDNAVPVLGGWIAGDSASYERLAKSVRNFPHQKVFVQAIRDAGFVMPGNGYQVFQWGMMVAYIGAKPKN